MSKTRIPLPRRPITQRDIAKLAGVSLTTIHNCLYASDLVLPETREHVFNIMRENDYQPNTIARAMVKGKTHVVGIVVPRLDIPYYTTIATELENNLNAGGYNSIICQHRDDHHKEERELNMLRSQRADGLIIRACGERDTPELYDRLEKAGVPFVLVDRNIPGMEERFIGVDGFKAAYDLTEYLIRKGHKRISPIVWHETHRSRGTRFEGYKQALLDNGLEFDESLVIDKFGEYFSDSSETVDMMRRNKANPPTAIISTDDTSIIGAVAALDKLGMKIPDDVAIASIGGYMQEFSHMARFHITTSRARMDAIAREATHMLCCQIDGKDWTRGPVLCQSDLIIGETT